MLFAGEGRSRKAGHGLDCRRAPPLLLCLEDAVKPSQDEQTYLAGVVSRAKALRLVFDGRGASVDEAREELSRFIGQPGRLLDLLRRCDRLYGLGDHAHRRLDWVGGEWDRFPRGSGMVWDWLADVEVLADLETCLKQAGETADKTGIPEDLQNLVLMDFDRTVFEEIAAGTTRTGIGYLANRLPSSRRAMHADPRTVRLSVDRLCALGLVEDQGGRNGIAVTAKGRQYAALMEKTERE
jgi:hypothetical protein